MKRTLGLMGTWLALTLAMPAQAQFAKAEDAIKYRQSALFAMGQHFGRLGAMANGRAPFDAKVAQENADIVAQMAKLPWAGFGPGTDKGSPTTTGQTIHRIDPSIVLSSAQSAGFLYVGKSDILANPSDDRTKTPFAPDIRRHTDQFLFKFRKPG